MFHAREWIASEQSQAARLIQPDLATARPIMLWTILIILLILWALGAFIVPVGGGLIHLLLVLALVVLVYQLVAGRRVP
ncbi:hypothetical protein A0J57_04920 [Sphingobium sp. 22B]|nr:hypothetical protein TZ53_21675 [Sphingobium sp. YBL2]KXU31073.1 hypothetical protein AXW74_14560 [Sphingobium sp. AM]KYC33460.1 hypothetical protein A0J57_04920 [Sphingobium sp. 22B]OAP32641.1 hypothetical protein A8O16_07040 [Sphingobium sp. 20006FA]PNQ04897.1 hypothetical protein A8G00_01680 [Sphingobium sp. SA916]